MRRSSLRCCILGTPAPLGGSLELQLQRYTGPRETAHYRADRNLHYFSSLLVAEPLDGNEQQGRSLIRRQAVKRPPNLVERKTGFNSAHRLIRAQPILGYIAILLAHVPRADLINPDRLHDAEHPAVKACALLKLVLPRERPLAGGLDEIIGIRHGPRQSARKTPQSRQDRN